MTVVFIIFTALMGASMMMAIIGVMVIGIVKAKQASENRQLLARSQPSRPIPTVPLADVHRALAQHAEEDQVLLVRCHQCQRLNEEHHKFCFECGASLT